MDGTLTVTPAALTVTADDKSKTYGAANPTLTHTTTGLVNGDTAGDLHGGSITCSTPADETSPVGDYPITLLRVRRARTTRSPTSTAPSRSTAATLTVTADDQTKIYGAANPALDAHDDRLRER